MTGGKDDNLEKAIITVLVMIGITLVVFVIGGHF
jgi:hypothetical protein